MSENVAENNIPKHIGIIMDGNGRWALKRGLPRSAGHKEGAKTFKVIAEHCQNIGVKYLTVYAFSTENWKRPQEEIDAIFLLLRLYIKKEKARLIRDKVNLSFIGDLSKFPEELLADIKMIREATGSFQNLHVNIAINYGGRDEIVHAAKKLCKEAADGTIKPEDINEKLFSS